MGLPGVEREPARGRERRLIAPISNLSKYHITDPFKSEGPSLGLA